MTVEPARIEQCNLVVRLRQGAQGKAYWDAQWRYRKGRCPSGWLDERSANVAAVSAMEGHAVELAESAQRARAVAEHRVTVRELAHEWLSWLEEVMDAKPSTIADYRFLIREPGIPHRRGGGVSHGRIMGALGDLAAAEVTTADVSLFLRPLDSTGLTPRSINKHRQVLAAMFAYGSRADTHALPFNPVTGTDKRRERPPAALDYYEVEEVEALARACENGEHRTGGPRLDESEAAARRMEDKRDAEAFRLLFYTGIRLGELLPLRWGDVDLRDRLLLIRRGLSAGQETLPKGRQHRFVQLSTPATATLARLAGRDEFTGPDDYVVCNRLGRRLDPSALRRRYKRACEAAGLRPVKLHGLRHAAGSLVARTTDAVFVRDFLGHAKLSTTDRYVSAKLRPEELARLDAAFAPARLELIES
ncbi:MAG: tyrosine-type recombinase/integrase [Solirubrobacteraceae bacterium]